MGQFASGVAHEIRNPLNAISMIVQRFQKEFEPKTDADEYFEMTRTVRSEIARIVQITRQFLAFARPAKLNKTPMAVDEMIMQSVNVVSAQAEAKHIRMVTGSDAQTVINVDKDQFHQALLNLLQNAMEAVEAGGTVSVDARRIDLQLCIQIKDDGPGIPPEQQKRIFDLYYTSKPTGTGLGLALVHRIVTEHDGDVAVQSRPGEGTTFTPQSRSKSLTQAGEKMNILVIDDEKSQRDSLAGFLKKRGCTLATASSGAAGIAYVAKHQIDVVLTDFRMPDKSGLEVLEAIKARNPTIDVVLMTAYGTIENAVAAMKTGAFDYLTKPIDLDELEFLLKKYRRIAI